MAGQLGGYVQPQGGGGTGGGGGSGGTLGLSGGTVSRALQQGPFFSGTVSTIITEESISGVRAVAISPSGAIRIAMASVINRMPAMGIVVDNVASGIQVDVYAGGFTQTPAGVADYSGYTGQMVYVGRSGQVVTASGSWNSGSFLSGDFFQPVGEVMNSGGFVFNLGAQNLAVPGLILSGQIASGQLSTYHEASGAFVMHAQGLAPINSGALGHSPAIITAEAISGVKAVQLDSSGHMRVAMAAVSGRMPACGVVYDNVASGIRANVHFAGFVQFQNAGSGQTVDFSGALGSRVWVGMSGNLLNASGALWANGGSGAWLSGSFMQPVGVVANSGGVAFNVGVMCFSGSISSGWNLVGLGVL